MTKPPLKTNIFLDIAHFIVELYDSMNLAIDIRNLATKLSLFIPGFRNAIQNAATIRLAAFSSAIFEIDYAKAFFFAI